MEGYLKRDILKEDDMGYYLVVYVYKGKMFEDAFMHQNEAERYAEEKKGILIHAIWMKRFD